MAGFSVPLERVFYQGVPAANAQVTVYQTGTTTKVTIYTDGSLSTPASNPISCDSNGEAVFYVATTVALRLYLTTSGGTLIRDIDPVFPVPNMAGFTGTGSDLNYLAGVTPGAATASKALVVDSNRRINNLAGEAVNTSSTYLANMAAVQGSLTGGGINRFLNGMMDVFQGGTSGTVSSGTTGYTADGWMIGATGNNVTWAKGYLGGAVNANSLYFDSIAGLTGVLVKQRIESIVANALAGQTVTVQATIFHNTGSSITPTLTVKRANAADNWGATTTEVNAVSLQSCTSGNSTVVAYTFTASTSAGNGLEITIDFGSAFNSGGKQCQITKCDIRATPGVSTGQNNYPPAVESRMPHVELAFAMRYYQKSFPIATTPAQNAGSGGSVSCVSSAAASFGATIILPARMRGTPTVTTYNPSASNANWRDVTAGADRVASVSNASENGFVIIGAAGVANDENRIHYTADARL